ncbi:hypothetical protein PIROE2DRAFT_57997 [Piromyces sp. E2]|nr:hypothetical protein PIROE2DRAFT_57997 [Piromyces sp. E2]|eukprot:OUM68556.1 hypothetical protein PIROE2DRAFT_57997 [Piromyces sp. E2]
MKIKYLLYSIYILCSAQISYEQVNNNVGNSSKVTTNTGDYQREVNPQNKIQMNYEENTPTKPQSTEQNQPMESEQNPSMESEQNQPLENEVTQTMENGQNNQYKDRSSLPIEINNYLKGYDEFNTNYNEELIKEIKENPKYGNLQCIKTLLSTIHFPLLYKDSDHYYKTVCNPNTSIDALQYLNETVYKNENICDDNGNNYKIAYKMLRVRHLQNCIRDIDGNGFCYENDHFYKKLLNEDIDIYRKYEFENINNEENQNDMNNYISSVRNKCASYTTADSIPFCSKIAIIANDIAKKSINEDISLEIYYVRNQTYKLDITLKIDVKQKDEAFEDKCKLNDIYQSLKKNYDNLELPVKKLLDIYDEVKNGSLSLYKNRMNILSLITVMITFFYMLM